MKNGFKKLCMIAIVLVCGLSANAQNVTVSPQTGSLIAALTTGSESGFENGYSAMWRHEQLPLTFTVSDFCNITEGGELQQPAGNFLNYNGNLLVDGGSNPDAYMCLSLPRGYKFTGYTIVLANNVVNRTINGTNHNNTGTKVFYEIDDLSHNSSTTTMDYDDISDQNYYTQIVNQIRANNAHYLAVAKKANGTFEMAGSNETDYYTITREAMTDTDMGNHLYFRISHSATGIYGMTIVSFEVRFSCEGTFEADVVPEEVGQARSVVTSPFQTSKIDIGGLKVEEKNGQQFFAYNYNNVRDLTAFNYIYQENAIENGVPTEGAEDKHIYPVKVDGQNLYAFCNDTYYAETPVQVHTQTGLEAPVGYRIVGARFNYLWGTATAGGTETRTNYYITATRNNTTYYLNDQLQFTTNTFAWSYDNATKCLYTGSGSNLRYLSCTGSGDTRTLTTSSESDNWYNLIVFTRGGTTYIGWDNNIATQRYYLRYYNSGTTRNPNWVAVVSRNTTTNAATVRVAEQEQVQIPSFTPGNYTLNVFDKTGTAVEKSINVNEGNAGGIIELEGLNNDAVKFQIANLEEGKQALVSVTLLIQALNPYINKMDVVCHDPDDQLTLSQQFTADDFSVSGGKFIFYIPQDYQNTELNFTFSDLYSNYGDDTYYTGTADQKDGNARYSFVTSDYFTPINGSGNDGLYDGAYNPDAAYTSKVVASTAGNIRFKFNNAEDLGNTGTGQGYLEETPFTVATYLASTDPDGSGATGQFIDCKLKASAPSQKSGTYYLFTADESRYNVAPTTAWQHRFYAFYRMDIELEAKSYTPSLTWTKLYDETLYRDGNAVKTNSQWGLKLGTRDGGRNVAGYLTVKEILDAVDARTKDDNAAPKETDQILYVDGSDLYSIISSTVTEGGTTKMLDLSSLKENLGKNAIIFLPENTTSTLDNMAFKTSTGSFRAGKDIVITDGYPFYSPQNIQVDGANYGRYTRMITSDKNGKVAKATIIVPFVLTVDGDGVHTNNDTNTQPFSLHTMQATDCLNEEDHEGLITADYAYFPSIVVPSVTKANTPYIVRVLNVSDEDNVIFDATQRGTTIEATSASMNTDYTFTGESAVGAAKGNNYSFTHYGTYTGKKLNKG